MMNRTKITRTIALFLLCLCILSGCGKQKVEYGTDTGSTEAREPEATEQATTLENEGTESDKELTGAIAKEIGAESTWEKEITWQKSTGGTGMIEINADVEVPDGDGMQVAKVSDRVFEPEVKKKIADALFDEESIVPVGNGGYETKEEIMDLIKANQKTLEEVAVDSYAAADLNAEIKRLQGLYDNFEEPEKGDFGVDKFKGTKNGRNYTLSFGDVRQLNYSDENGNDVSYNIMNSELIFFSDFPRNFYGKENVSFGLADSVCDFGENKATITKEQAEEIVKHFLETAEIDGMEIYEGHNLNWVEYSDENGSDSYEPIECNGYIFTLYRKIQDCFVTGKIPTNQIRGTVYDTHDAENMSIAVTDEGIIQVEYYNPIKVEEIMTEHTEMLSFENIKNVMEGYVADRYSGYTSGSTKLSHMELTYSYSRETIFLDSKAPLQKTYYYMIPVWSLYRFGIADSGNWITSVPPQVEGVVINAIDGSLLK